MHNTVVGEGSLYSPCPDSGAQALPSRGVPPHTPPPHLPARPARPFAAQVWEMYKKAESAFWTAEELDLAHDTKVRARAALCA